MMNKILAGAAGALLLAACGGGNETQSDSRTSGETGAATPEGSRSAAAGAPAGARCPARTNSALTGPDIIGLKLGMTREEALNVVNCHAPDAYVHFDANWFDRRTLNAYQTTLEKQAFTAQSGDTSECDFRSFSDMQRCGMGNRVWDHVSESIRVATPGAPGREVVVGVWRTQNFKEGATPAVESVIAALTEKYGPFQKRDARPINNNLWSQRIDLAWSSGVDGAPLSEANPMFNQCAYNVRAGAEEGQTWRDGCGMSIAVTLFAPRTNPDVVGQLSVGMMNQSDLYEYGEALQAELEAIEQRRRQDELEKAKSAGDVKL